MKEFVLSEVKTETAVLVGLITKDQDEAKTKESRILTFPDLCPFFKLQSIAPLPP